MRMPRLATCAAAFAALFLIAPAVGQACSRDDSVFYETFIDLTCLEQPLTNTTFDALGGLRLTTTGAPTTATWDSQTEFDSGVMHESITYPSVGARTLVRTGSGQGALLALPATLLPLAPGASSVLGPTVSAALDSDHVDDPAVARVGSTYVMWYSATADDGGKPAIFMATSSDGTTWSRANSGAPVLQGSASAFDESGVYGAEVVYDAGDVLAPYRMWYSGRAGPFGAIGYATSVDGVNWMKLGAPGPPMPVLEHGVAGSADSFSAGDPSVLKDGSTWKMWYTGDDSNKKRIAYATSTDGITWSKGGKVIAPEDPGVSANIEFGAFAPTVWKTSTGYSMLLTGRKLVGGGEFQTKLMGSTSPDGVSWSGPSPALNPSGSNTNFDYSNLNSPELVQDPGAPTPYKLYYSGNTLDANGNFHTRIGLATSNNGSSFNKVNGSQTGGAVFDIGALGTAFDGRAASGLSAAAPAGATTKFVGFYWGTRGSDFRPRLGEATSPDGTAWTKVSASGTGGALFPLGNGAAFDNGGQRDPSILADSPTFQLYFTALDSSGTRSIGYASASEDAASKLPNNASWSARSQVLNGDGSGFDASAVAHPSVIKDGATYVMYYAGLDSGGTAKIGRATAASASGPFTRSPSPVLDVGAAGAFDAASVKDPVVVRAGAGDYRMLYTGVETLEGEAIERVAYATSSDGVTWTKAGVVLGPSLTTYAYDEAGVQPAGMLVDGSTLHVWTTTVDRRGRTRSGHATTAYPTPVSPQAGVPSGWATYQLGGPATSNRDFRQIVRTSTGSAVALWMSFLQPYSSNGSEFWSDYFPVTASSPSEALNFLLTVRGVRWQARLSGPAGGPSIERVDLTHAPVTFAPNGSAVSAAIGPSSGRVVTAWKALTATMDVFSPGGGGSASANARLVDAATGEQVAAHLRRDDARPHECQCGRAPVAAREPRSRVGRRSGDPEDRLVQSDLRQRGHASASAASRTGDTHPPGRAQDRRLRAHVDAYRHAHSLGGTARGPGRNPLGAASGGGDVRLAPRRDDGCCRRFPAGRQADEADDVQGDRSRLRLGAAGDGDGQAPDHAERGTPDRQALPPRDRRPAPPESRRRHPEARRNALGHHCSRPHEPPFDLPARPEGDEDPVPLQGPNRRRSRAPREPEPRGARLATVAGRRSRPATVSGPSRPGR